MLPPKSAQARPLETPLELGDPNCPSSTKLQTTFPHAGNLGQPILSILDRRFRHTLQALHSYAQVTQITVGLSESTEDQAHVP